MRALGNGWPKKKIWTKETSPLPGPVVGGSGDHTSECVQTGTLGAGHRLWGWGIPTGGPSCISGCASIKQLDIHL